MRPLAGFSVFETKLMLRHAMFLSARAAQVSHMVGPRVPNPRIHGPFTMSRATFTASRMLRSRALKFDYSFTALANRRAMRASGSGGGRGARIGTSRSADTGHTY